MSFYGIKCAKEIPSTYVVQEPIRPSKEVWILHPEHYDTAIAQGKSGVHYKMARSKMPEDKPCEPGVQWVHVQSVFVPGVVPMYAGKQKHLRIVEDTIATKSEGGGWMMWSTDYLLEVL